VHRFVAAAASLSPAKQGSQSGLLLTTVSGAAAASAQLKNSSITLRDPICGSTIKYINTAAARLAQFT
jgi:hypothetical protein